MNDKLYKTVLRFGSHICNQAARIRVKLTEGPTTWANIREGKIVHVVFKHLYKSMYHAKFIQLKVWWHDFCFFVYFIVHKFIPSHSFRTFIRHHSPKFLSILSSLGSSVGKTSLGCRAKNQTRTCLTASRRTTNWATPQPFWATQHLYWATPQPYWATLHPYWATPHPYWTTMHPYWATSHPCWATPQLYGASTLHYLISQTPIILL